MSEAVAVDALVLGAGPAGLMAALRAGQLGARTALVTRDAVGGMAAHDGPVPVRTLAHAGRLLRDARRLSRYGITVSEPQLEYARLLGRVGEVVEEVRGRAAFAAELEAAGVTVHEHVGPARFLDAHTVRTQSGLVIRAEKIVLCPGGRSRQLAVPGFELTRTHSDAWSLTSVPPSLLVLGGGATGVQVASIFHAFGSRVAIYQSGPRILSTEDEDVSKGVAAALRSTGIAVHEGFGSVVSFEKSPNGVRMVYAKDGLPGSAEATIAVAAVGWVADTEGLGLEAACVETNRRGFVRVDSYLRTSAPHVFAAGDVTGQLMLVPQAMQAGFLAATNAVRNSALEQVDSVAPIGSFTDPEYAQVGLTEAAARAAHDIVVVMVHYDATTRAIIDGVTTGFCKLIVERASGMILGCHVVGERAVDIVQTAAIAISARLRVDTLARIPLSFPTYTGILGRAAASAAYRLNLPLEESRFAERL